VFLKIVLIFCLSLLPEGVKDAIKMRAGTAISSITSPPPFRIGEEAEYDEGVLGGDPIVGANEPQPIQAKIP
jgi:hypothetical protein